MSTEKTDTNDQAQNYLEMSDEDILKMPTPDFTAATVTVETPTTEVTTGEKPAEGSAATGSGEGGEDEGDKDGGNKTTTAEVEGEGEGTTDADGGTPAKDVGTKPGDEADPDKKKDEKSEKKDGATKEGGEKDAATGAKEASTEPAKQIDYEAEYKRLLAPFKANGRQVQVGSVDDAINLMQMGANYNKRMAALKPHMKFMKMLENNGLLDEGKLSFLIDLDKKNPAAINKLVKDSGIDPMEIDGEKASAYKQSATYAVDDREIELDTVLDEIKDSSAYTRTLDVVSNKWDVASKQVIAQNPQLLRVVNDHMANGIYDLISAEIERERMFGRLKGVTDLEAYRKVGDAIQERGGFNHLFAGKTQQQTTADPAAPVVVTPKPKADNAALNDKRRAASPPKPAAPTTTPKDFNPLAMSDEEFSKLAAPAFK